MRISTVIPAYNRADLIAETLRSVLGQSHPPAEVIVVDDGSTDGTPEVVAGFGKDVTLLRQANAGAGAARNAGFARATGELIHFMDSDDLSSLNTYAVQADAVAAQGAGMAYGPMLKVQFGDGVVAPEPVALQQRPLPAAPPMDRLILRGRWVTVFQPCLFRRDVIEAAGPYRTDLKPSEDTEMLYRIARHVKHAAHTPETIVLYRVHPENQVSARAPERRAIDWANLWDVLAEDAAARSDLDGRTLRMARRMRHQAVAQLAAIDAQLAAGRAPGPGIVDRALAAADRMALRIGNKINRALSGNPYFGPQGAGPVTAGQRAEIARLGYRLGTPLRV